MSVLYTDTAVFEYETHEILIQGAWISVDGHRAVHLSRVWHTISRHPLGVVIDGTLFAFSDLYRIVQDTFESEE